MKIIYNESESLIIVKVSSCCSHQTRIVNINRIIGENYLL